MNPPKEPPPSVPYALSAEDLASISNRDRMLPSQPMMRKWFKGDEAAFHSSLEALILGILPFQSVGEHWDLELKPGVTYASLGSDVATLSFFQMLVRLGDIKTILELGTFIGVSTLFFAEAVGPAGTVTTVERGEEFFAIARRNFERNGLAGRIRPILGDALAVLRQYWREAKLFDLVLLDAGKEDYAEMLAPALGCLAPGGLLIVDDVFLNGDALNLYPETNKGKGVQKLLRDATAIAREHQGVILPIGNGLLLIRKNPG